MEESILVKKMGCRRDLNKTDLEPNNTAPKALNAGVRI